MNSWFLHHFVFCPFSRVYSRTTVKTSAIPYTSNVVARDYLNKATSFEVADFYEATIEKEHVWRMHSNSICSAFPFNRTSRTAWIATSINEEAKFLGGRGGKLVNVKDVTSEATNRRSKAGTRLH